MKRLLALTVLFSSIIAFSVEEVKLHGAITTIDKIAQYKSTVEKQTGTTLTIVGNTGGKGLVDLLEGKCDVALAADSLDTAVAAAKKAGKSVDINKLKFTELSKDEVVFIVNKKNSVSSLTMEQIKNIFIGKIKNWKEVGGENEAIVLFLDSTTGATRAYIKTNVLGGAEYDPAGRTLETVKFINTQVTSYKNSIGGLSSSLVKSDGVKILKTDKKLERPLGFITLGEPTVKVKKVIDTFKAQIK